MNRDFLDMMLVLDHTHSVILTNILCYYCSASGSARISKSGGLEYVNIGTPEETLLETYFVTLSKFNFDRAREQCVSLIFKINTCTAYSALVHVALSFFYLLKDRERENKGSGGGTNWCEFMSVLSRLATAESVYFSLGFMERPGGLGRFVRKEVREII